MHREDAGREIRRYAEERTPEILDTCAAEVLLESPRHLVALDQREERQRVVVDRVRIHKRAAQPVSYLGVVPFHRDSRTYNCTHAAAPDSIDRYMRFAQRPNDAEVRKTSRPAS